MGIFRLSTGPTMDLEMGKWVKVVRRADGVETACLIRAAIRRWQVTMGQAR